MNFKIKTAALLLGLCAIQNSLAQHNSAVVYASIPENIQPGATVQTTFGMISGCRNVHPIATRALTVREAARLQSFPDSFVFGEALGTMRTGIGNAVPPLLAYQIAKHLASEFL